MSALVQIALTIIALNAALITFCAVRYVREGRAS